MLLKAIIWLLVSRQSADTYTVHGGKTIHTVGCTQNARLMRAYVEPDSRGVKHLVFVDSAGEIEATCRLK